MKNTYQNINQYLEYPIYPTNYEFYNHDQASLNSSIGLINQDLFVNELDEQQVTEMMTVLAQEELANLPESSCISSSTGQNHV
jgi:hypothetical protein